MNRLLVARALVLVATVFAAGAEPSQNADWTIPVPEGTPVIEYEPVPDAERTARIELVEDLVIGGGSNNPDYMFYGARAIEVDGEGRIYVLDTGNSRVQVFDSKGEFLRSIGRKGQGPGEFMHPSVMALRGGRLFVGDFNTARVSVWTLDADEPINDFAVVRRLMAAETLIALANGGFMIAYDDRIFPASREIIARLSATAEIEESYIDRTRQRAIRRKDRDYTHPGPMLFSLPSADPSLAGGPDGSSYLTNGDEYQVLALDPNSEPRWVLRVAAEKHAFIEEYVEEYVESAGERSGVTLSVSEFEDWRPEYFPVIRHLSVDGRGRLWVFPYSAVSPEVREEVPVDIYSPDGDRVLAALFPNVVARQVPVGTRATMPHWLAAFEDYVYAIEMDPDTEEQRVVRYRLVLPGQ